jgi:hypothetical protein
MSLRSFTAGGILKPISRERKVTKVSYPHSILFIHKSRQHSCCAKKNHFLGAKAHLILGICGVAEATPFQNRFSL